MPKQRRTQVIVVGGALAIASVAYGLGSQAGDGTAIAENSQNGERGVRVALERGGACGFSGLADELGVDENKLEQALRDFRSSQDDDMRDGFAADLADALGVSEDKVSSALDKLHAQREDRFDRMGPRDLPRPPGGARFHFGAPLRDLAKELGVTRSELRSALREVGQKAGDRFEEHRKELAEFLADRLGLDVDEVLDALPAEGPRLRSMHPPGLPDHP